MPWTEARLRHVRRFMNPNKNSGDANDDQLQESNDLIQVRKIESWLLRDPGLLVSV